MRHSAIIQKIQKTCTCAIVSDLKRGVSGLVAVFVILYPPGKLQNKIIFDVLVCRRKSHCSRCYEEEEHRWVCYQGDCKVDSVRHLRLEVYRPRGHVAGENAVITVAVPSPSASNSEIPSNQSQEGTFASYARFTENHES